MPTTPRGIEYPVTTDSVRLAYYYERVAVTADAAITNLVPSSGTPPAGPVEGKLWWDSTNDRLMVYNGTAWRRVTPAGGFATPTPTGGGFATIAHGLGYAPTWATVAVGRSTGVPTAVDKIAELYLTGADATNITLVVLRKDTQAGQDGSPVGVAWAAV